MALYTHRWANFLKMKSYPLSDGPGNTDCDDVQKISPIIISAGSQLASNPRKPARLFFNPTSSNRPSSGYSWNSGITSPGTVRPLPRQDSSFEGALYHSDPRAHAPDPRTNTRA